MSDARAEVLELRAARPLDDRARRSDAVVGAQTCDPASQARIAWDAFGIAMASVSVARFLRSRIR